MRTPRPIRNRCSRFSTPEKTEVRYNSEWLGKLDYERTIRLTAHFTVSQMLERDEFHKRFQRRTANKPCTSSYTP